MLKKPLLLICSLLFLLNFPIFAQTVDEIVNKNIEARGGLEKLKALKSMKFTGKIKIPLQEGLAGPIVVYSKRPNFIRVEFTLQGKTNIEAYDGEIPWMIMPLTGSKVPQKMSGVDAQDIIEQADFDGPLVEHNEKGNKIELIGKEDLKGTPAYKLKVTLKTGEIRYFFLDAENYLDLKMTKSIVREGREMTIDTYLDGYKEISGLMVPFSIEAQMGNTVVSQIGWDNVEFEIPIEDIIFKMPSENPQSAPSN